MNARVSARALLTDPDDRVLLLRVHDEVPWDAADPVIDYWITVGGGVENGESLEEALIREVLEETGHRIERSGPCIWRRRRTMTDLAGVTRVSDEHYFHCPVPSRNLSVDQLTDLERSVIREFR